MSLLDPAARAHAGEQACLETMGFALPPATTLLQESVRDFVFAEVWTRPGLDRRSRRWITLACAGANQLEDLAQQHVRSALSAGDFTLAEMREAVLHFAVYSGWPRAAKLEAAVNRAAGELGLTAQSPPVRAEPWDPADRLAKGAANFETVMTFPGPRQDTAYYGAGIMNFVFGEMWMRPGLDQRARRWITLACVGESGAANPILTHVYAAMKSGDATLLEMQEFVLQFAVYCGWPKGSVLQSAVDQMGERVAGGLPYS